MQLNKAENAWRPSTRKSVRNLRKEQVATDNPEQVKSQQLFKHLRGILNKLTPEKFQELIKQVQELTIDTEERLKGAINLIFEKAILEPNFSVVYASMCHCFRRVSFYWMASVVCSSYSKPSNRSVLIKDFIKSKIEALLIEFE